MVPHFLYLILISFFSSVHQTRQVMIPILEFIDPNDPEGGRHYWPFNINIRDQTFEVLDSMRKLEHPNLMNCTSTIAGVLRMLWREHYSKAKIYHFPIMDINVPKQLGT